MKKIYVVFVLGGCDSPYCDGAYIPHPKKAFVNKEKAEEFISHLKTTRYTSPFDKFYIEELELQD